MRYLLKIFIVTALEVLLFFNRVQAQETQPLGERLGHRTEALMEMSRIGQLYQATDLLSYDISYDFADSVAPSVILEHKAGKYGMYNSLFWGKIDTTMEYLQGQQYYVVADHEMKSIYIYNKLEYSRAINIPLLDSLFNEVSLKDLLLTRPGGVFKKLTIQYNPNMQYKQVELLYDSTTYLLKSIAYYYNAAIYSGAYTNCQDSLTVLDVPATGVLMPGTVTCATLIKTYKSFIAEFPNHTKGATVRVYSTSGVAYQNSNQAGQNELATNAGANTDKEIKELWIVPQSVSGVARPAVATDTITPPPPKKMLKASLLLTGSWVDSSMTALQLFEWHMNEHLGVQYTGNVYADWLVNTCGHKLNQLPWSETTIVRQDTLQNIWNRFVARYPGALTSITETVSVPVIKGVITNTLSTVDGYDGEYLSPLTWTNGGWYIQRGSNTYDLSVLPRNASIQAASLNLYAFRPPWRFASHFRNVSQFPFMQIQPVRSIYIPGKTGYDIAPENYPGMSAVGFAPLSTNQVSSGNPSDFWSEQDYTSQNVLSMVSGMYNNLNTTGINYPVQYKLNDESYVYKGFYFGGTECSNAAKRPTLNVSYTASRCEVFTAFVNRALGTWLSYDDVIALYKYAGKLEVNSNCTTATPGLGCEGDPGPGRPITGITTISFTKTDETTLDLNLFNESRFFYKVGTTFSPQEMYAGYTIIPVFSNNQ